MGSDLVAPMMVSQARGYHVHQQPWGSRRSGIPSDLAAVQTTAMPDAIVGVRGHGGGGKRSSVSPTTSPTAPTSWDPILLGCMSKLHVPVGGGHEGGGRREGTPPSPSDMTADFSNHIWCGCRRLEEAGGVSSYPLPHSTSDV